MNVTHALHTTHAMHAAPATYARNKQSNIPKREVRGNVAVHTANTFYPENAKGLDFLWAPPVLV